LEVAVEVPCQHTGPTSHDANLCVPAGLVTHEALVVAQTISFSTIQPAS